MIVPSKVFNASRIATDGMSKCSRIDHDATCGFPCLVNPVDDLVFTVRLMKAKLKSKLSSDPAAIGLDIGKSFVTVDIGLTFAEQIQVGTVQYVGDAVHVGLRDQACLMWAAARRNCQFPKQRNRADRSRHERRRSTPSAAPIPGVPQRPP